MSFFISAWIHHPADYMMLGKYGAALKFFLSQAVFITFKGFIIALGRRAGPWGQGFAGMADPQIRMYYGCSYGLHFHCLGGYSLKSARG